MNQNFSQNGKNKKIKSTKIFKIFNYKIPIIQRTSFKMDFNKEILQNNESDLMLYHDQLWQQQQFEEQQQFFISLLYTNHTQTFETYTPIYIPPLFNQDTQHYNTKRMKNIIPIIDPDTNLEVNIYQNDIGTQTDDLLEPMTIDRYDRGIQTDNIDRRKIVGTQTLGNVIYNCTQTVDAALGSSTLREDRLLQRRKFKDDTTELAKPTLISNENDIKLKSCLRKHSAYDPHSVARKDTYIHKKKVSFNLPHKKKVRHTFWKKARKLLCSCFNF